MTNCDHCACKEVRERKNILSVKYMKTNSLKQKITDREKEKRKPQKKEKTNTFLYKRNTVELQLVVIGSKRQKGTEIPGTRPAFMRF